MVIKQGEIYWVELGDAKGSEPAYRYPHVVVQNNLFNSSKLNTIVVCALTSNLKRASAPGNVVLPKGEANLPKKSVVNISQIYTVNQFDLVEKIGKVSDQKFQKILDGLKLLLEPRSQ